MNRYIIQLKTSGNPDAALQGTAGGKGLTSVVLRAESIDEAIRLGAAQMGKSPHQVKATPMEDAGTTIIMPPGADQETIKELHRKRGDTETTYLGPM